MRDLPRMHNGFYHITRNMLFLQWEAPVAVIDIDVPAPGHVAHGTVTARSKAHAFELMRRIACHKGTRMCVRVYETAGGLRGFVTSHRISAAHLWHEPDLAQHFLDSGQDPYFLVGCMATCLFSARLSPKWIGDRPREDDVIAFRGVINDDLAELPDSVDFVSALDDIQRGFEGLHARPLLDALARFRARHERFFDAAPPAKPWTILEGLYEDDDPGKRGRDRVLVRDVRRWKRTVPIPGPSCDFMSGPAAPQG